MSVTKETGTYGDEEDKMGQEERRTMFENLNQIMKDSLGKKMVEKVKCQTDW